MAARHAYVILFIGPKWFGSDSAALANAFRSLGHAVIQLDPEDYFPIRWESRTLRAVRRLLRGRVKAEFNRAVRRVAETAGFDFVVVFKGKLLTEGTISRLRAQGKRVFLFYPDLNFRVRGELIWKCLPLYDHVFTTKAWHLDDEEIRRRVRGMSLVRHGFDPRVHRVVPVGENVASKYRCDVSFVGAWSARKEEQVRVVMSMVEGITFHLWGPGWERSSGAIRKIWLGRAARGDELALQYRFAAINLGLLSGGREGERVRDETSTRTWHIPACGGFLLHEDTREVRRYFEPGIEIGVFRGLDGLIENVRYFLANVAAREAVRIKGVQRVWRSGYDYEEAASCIIERHRNFNGFAFGL